MNLKLKRFGITMLSFLLLLTSIVPAYALEGRASPVFESGYVITDSSLYTEFGASTQKDVKNLYVSSVTLQEMDRKGNVLSSKALAAPTEKVHDNCDITVWKTYSATSGKKYRIKAVFYADGYYITRYSNIVTYR